MSPLAARIARFLRERRLLASGDRIIVALSGGPDSVALLHVLLECAVHLDASVAGVAHLNHLLRGEAANQDERFCRDLAARLGLPAHVERMDVLARARAEGRSIEDAGHAARYAFFDRAIDALGGSVIATGHTANDQAETVLLRLARGAGLSGLSGIQARAGAVIRPLLEVPRPAILKYLAARGLDWRDDQTNADLSVPRNRMRHRVVPVLETEASPGIVEQLGRTARILADEEALLSQLARLSAGSVIGREGGTPSIDLDGLAAEPAAIQRRLVYLLLSEALGPRTVSATHVESVLALAIRGRPGSSLSLPGQRAAIDRRLLVIRPVSAAVASAPVTGAGTARRQVPIPGVLWDEAGRWSLTVEAGPVVGLAEAKRLGASGDVAVVDAHAAGPVLFVRHWRPGDRLRPLGMAGSRKLQDVFVDRKIPRDRRFAVPLVVDDRDRIVWVAGVAVAEAVRVTSGTTGVLLLRFRRSEVGGEV
jgi:tRNA(Ile)-lysidine synthase